MSTFIYKNKDGSFTAYDSKEVENDPLPTLALIGMIGAFVLLGIYAIIKVMSY